MSHRQPAPRQRRIIWWRLLLVLAAAFFALGVLGTAGLVFYFSRGLPNIDTLTQGTAASSTIYDVNNQYVTTIGLHNTIPVTLGQVPHDFLRALIDTEDHSFYTNDGVSFRGIARSVLADLRGGGFVEGASTITQQLVRDRYLTDQKSIGRKIREVLLALEVTRAYTKNEIMLAYLNEVYLGNGAYGIGAAAHMYFGENPQQLDLAQCALLAGLPQAPSYLDPYYNLKGAKYRQKIVLQNMVTAGDITQKQADAAYAEPLHLQSDVQATTYPDPWFVEAVVTQLQKHIPISKILNGGLKIYTTLDPKIEQIAQTAVTDVMNHSFSNSTEPQAAAVVMDPKNGYVLAIVGGRTHTVAFPRDRALAPYYRQSGSAIKPLAEYPAAIQSGQFTEATVLDDGPWLKVNGKWWPQNDTLQYYGRITVRHSLAISDNNNSVHLLDEVGLANGFNMATQKFGLPLIKSGQPNDYNLAMGIGGLTRGVTVKEMADAYSTYANEGLRPNAIMIRKVVAPGGTVLYSQTPHLTPELSQQVSYIMINMMEAVFSEPGATAYGASIGRPAAGKTGTSNQGRDGWFVGFTPQLVTAVWEGYDNEQPQPNTYGATYALPIWVQIMRQATASMPVQNFSRPPGIVSVTVDDKSGLLPSALTPAADKKSYLFIQGTQPTQQSQVWTQQMVDAAQPNLLWQLGCPGPIPKVFLTVPTDISIGPGIPKPLDSNLWVPTQYCNPSSPFGGGPGGGVGLSQPLSLTIQQSQFSPSQLTVSVGQQYTLTVQNNDTAPHQFQLQNFMPAPETIAAGGQITVTFTPAQPGQYIYQLTDVPGAQGTVTAQ